MQNTSHKLTPLALLAALFLAGCGGGSSDSGVPGTSGDFLVLRSDPPDNAQLFLNEAINVDFTNRIDIGTANFDAVSFAVFDLNMNPMTETVTGTFHVERSPGDLEKGRRLQFRPRFPKSDTFDDGGFKPGRIYFVQLVEGNHHTGVGLRDMSNKGLGQPFTFQFTTADGTTPSQLFRDTRVGGPRRTGLDITPRTENNRVALNELGQKQVEIRLDFDQPLNPHSDNVPFKVDLDPTVRQQSQRGRIFLEYDSRTSKDQWIPAEVDLERNELDGATVVLRPIGVLPNNATIRVIVESTLEDMSGESNVNNAAYNRVFAEFQTDDSYALRFDAVVEDFMDTSRVDLQAPFLEPLAELVPGAIRANFDFEGSDTNLRYEPNTPEVILNTDFTQITPKNAPKINVSGGVFEFRSVTIPEGVTVRATGSKPMVWLVLEDFIVKGRLLADGGLGQGVDTLNSANFPAAGGVAGPGGGNGGQGSPQTTVRSTRGETGYGPGQKKNGGGQGGQLACSGSCTAGSGGGGGSHATKGDPWYKAKAAGGNRFPQQKGQGGFGCSIGYGSSRRTLSGGLPGPVIFTDPRVDNDFWGSAVNILRQSRITGELAAPVGGAGGGGGGDYSLNRSCNVSDPNFSNDDKGGGGGGGGGVIIVKALGSIKIDRNGLISAAGGDGGGGAQARSNNRGGGGGGGSGGMIVLMAGDSIDIVVHGTNVNSATYGDGDYEFCISADGGASRRQWLTQPIRGKYSPSPSPSLYDASPTGGLGGMGVIQLMAPPGVPGPTSVDGTNTVLDDNINFRVGSLTATPVNGADKMKLIAWRGMPDEGGTMRDDKGQPVNIGDNEGDMRPSPFLAPAPFGSRSRARSKWTDLGAVVRRIVSQSAGDGQPGGVFDPGAGQTGQDFGPQPFFDGTEVATSTAPDYGYVRYKDDGQGGVTIDYDEVARGTVDSARSGRVHKGQSVYEVRLTTSELGGEVDRYSHYTAQLLTGSTVRAEFRILGHNANTLYLRPVNELGGDDSLPSGINTVRVLAKFFNVFTGTIEGFSQTYQAFANQNPNKGLAPKANIQIGFAFHKDPADVDDSTPGEDQNRFPKRLGTFLYDLNDPLAVEVIRTQHLRFVQWDLLFDTDFEPNPQVENPDSLSPQTPRPELRRLVLPYRY